MEHCYDYAMTAITVDIAIFRINDKGAVQVLVIKRGCQPHKGSLSLIGGHCELETETIYESLVRETKEEVGVNVEDNTPYFVGFYDHPNRDTRGRVISFLYTRWLCDRDTLEAGDDAESFEWVSFNDVMLDKIKPAFDHNEMVMDAWEKLSNDA